MRATGIEIKVNNDKLTQSEQDYLKENFDYQYNSDTGFWTLWIHDNGYKPFTRELFQYLHALHSVYNRKTGTTHLDLFLEVGKKVDIDEYGKEITLEDGTVKYFKNLVPEDLFSVDLESVILKRELSNF
jgi:hypothetical protein